jgi:hypothetical protein
LPGLNIRKLLVLTGFDMNLDLKQAALEMKIWRKKRQSNPSLRTFHARLDIRK